MLAFSPFSPVHVIISIDEWRQFHQPSNCLLLPSLGLSSQIKVVILHRLGMIQTACACILNCIPALYSDAATSRQGMQRHPASLCLQNGYFTDNRFLPCRHLDSQIWQRLPFSCHPLKSPLLPKSQVPPLKKAPLRFLMYCFHPVTMRLWPLPTLRQVLWL